MLSENKLAVNIQRRDMEQSVNGSAFLTLSSAQMQIILELGKECRE